MLNGEHRQFKKPKNSDSSPERMDFETGDAYFEIWREAIGAEVLDPESWKLESGFFFSPLKVI